MEPHHGRMFDHVHLQVRDLEASKRFSRAVLEVMGLPVFNESERHLAADELFLSNDREPTARVHLAFQAKDRELVHRFHLHWPARGDRELE